VFEILWQRLWEYGVNVWSYLKLCLLGHKIFTQPDTYCPTDYCPNNMVRLSVPTYNRVQHEVYTKKRTSILLNTTWLRGQVSVVISKLSTILPPAVPNWLQSSLEPRAWLYMQVAGNCNDHWPRVDFRWDKRVSKIQGGWYSEVELSSSVRKLNFKPE